MESKMLTQADLTLAENELEAATVAHREFVRQVDQLAREAYQAVQRANKDRLDHLADLKWKAKDRADAVRIAVANAGRGDARPGMKVWKTDHYGAYGRQKRKLVGIVEVFTEHTTWPANRRNSKPLIGSLVVRLLNKSGEPGRMLAPLHFTADNRMSMWRPVEESAQQVTA